MTSSPTAQLPSKSVPVTTVPKPSIVKTRSMGRRNSSGSLRRIPTPRTLSKIICFSLSILSPVKAETRIRSAFSKKLPFTSSETSSSTSSAQSSSTRSALVKTMIPWRIWSIFKISKCSTVWGMTPSSSPTTRSTRSMPPIPASIFFTNFSWPGTSIIPIWSPSSLGRLANPSSMVIPLFCSSFNRSVSIPVRALIRQVFP